MPICSFTNCAALPADVEVTLRPVLIAGLSQRLGPGSARPRFRPRRAQTFLLWPLAGRGPAALPFTAPPRHPFNPLALLRLTLALGSTPAVVGAIFDHLWANGRDGQDPADP